MIREVHRWGEYWDNAVEKPDVEGNTSEMKFF
jgi:hypothetical protein